MTSIAERFLPPFPDAPADRSGAARLSLRYEDVSQDGRLSCRAMTHALGPTLWERVLLVHPIAPKLFADGIVPILSRLVVVSEGGPIAVGPRPDTRGSFALVRAIDGAGRPRFRMDMSIRVEGTIGRTHGAAPPRAGEHTSLGGIHAEHVLTRPFGAPERRRVEALPADVATDRDVRWREPDEALALPEGARWLDDDFVPDAHVLTFGLGHTDSNQHVNSLVYPLAIEEAALRHTARPDAASFCHHFDLSFRKPFFAGEKLRVTLRAYERGTAFGVAARCLEATRGEVRATGRLELVP